MLIENTLFGIQDKVQIAIDRLNAFEPTDGYYVAYSGGKDSEVILDLVKKSGCKFDAHYNVTSVDAPETVYFIRNEHPEVIWEFPKDKDGKVITMWSLIPQRKLPPTQLVRYCCQELKEGGGMSRVVVTGVRWAESVKRKKNRGLVNIGNTKKDNLVLNLDNDDAKRMVEQCYRTQKTLVNPIIDWTDADVWEYIKTNNLKYNPLYDKGYKRVGCVGCPMSSKQAQELEMYPQIKKLYLRAFGKMLDCGKYESWNTPQDVYDWWIRKSGKILKEQTTLFDGGKDD